MRIRSDGYWFRPRRYGYGASPVAWQGWTAIAAFPVACLAAALALFAWLPPVAAFIAFAVLLPAAVFAFIAFVRRKTDGPWH